MTENHTADGGTDGLREAAQALLNACVEDMGCGDEAGNFPDPDDEPVGRSATKPCAVQFGHLRRLRAALAQPKLAPPADGGTEGLKERIKSLEDALALEHFKSSQLSKAYWESAAGTEALREIGIPEDEIAALATRIPAGAAGDLVGENEANEAVARALYEYDNRNLRNVWRWDQDGLEAEHPGVRDRYLKQAAVARRASLATRPAPPAPAASAGGDETRPKLPEGWIYGDDLRAAALTPAAPVIPAGREEIARIIRSNVFANMHAHDWMEAGIEAATDAILAARPVADGVATWRPIADAPERGLMIVDGDGPEWHTPNGHKVGPYQAHKAADKYSDNWPRWRISNVHPPQFINPSRFFLVPTPAAAPTPPTDVDPAARPGEVK